MTADFTARPNREVARCRLAGQTVGFSHPIRNLAPLKSEENVSDGRLFEPDSAPFALARRTEGRVGDGNRGVEVWEAPAGRMVRVAGAGDFFISGDGGSVGWVPGRLQAGAGGRAAEMGALDRDVLLGPVLVLALATCGTWCLHASAVEIGGRAMLFLGASGSGKSTLAEHLSSWGAPPGRLVADDILPAAACEGGWGVFPRFPQLKLPCGAQPWAYLPERMPVGWVVSLERADAGGRPALGGLSPARAARELLGHTAGTRLFGPDMLREHLSFCARAAERAPAYRLVYPHRRSALPEVQEMLERLW